MDTGGFPVDLVLFGMIAGFLVLRLRSILGRRTGYERPPAQRQGSTRNICVRRGRLLSVIPRRTKRWIPAGSQLISCCSG